MPAEQLFQVAEVRAVPAQDAVGLDRLRFGVDGGFGVDEALGGQLELRVYRLRCVDADRRAGAGAAVEGKVDARVEGPGDPALESGAEGEGRQEAGGVAAIVAQESVFDFVEAQRGAGDFEEAPAEEAEATDESEAEEAETTDDSEAEEAKAADDGEEDKKGS